MSESLSMPVRREFILEPEHLHTGHCMSAEMRVFDAGATWNGPDDGRFHAVLVIGTWNKYKAEDPRRDSRDFDGVTVYFADPATAHSAADVLRETADQLDLAADAMQFRINELIEAEKRARGTGIDCLRWQARMGRAQQALTAVGPQAAEGGEG